MRYYVVPPYPDEELGSIVTRATRELGLSVEAFSHWYLGLPRNTQQVKVSNLLRPMSEVCGLSPSALLWRHTLVPYGLVGLPTTTARNVVRSLTAGHIPKHVAPVGKVVRRWCPVCVKADLTTHGVCYWHRSHLLPGVGVCHLHGTALLQARKSLRYMTIGHSVTYWNRHDLPNELVGQHADFVLSQALQRQISRWSARALLGRRGLKQNELSLKALLRVFDAALLRHVGCMCRSRGRYPPTTIMILCIVAQQFLEEERALQQQLEFPF